MCNTNWTLCDGVATGMTTFAKGTLVTMSYTWGYDENDNMTKPRDIRKVLPTEMTVGQAIQFIMDVYATTVTHPRFYYVEAITTGEVDDEIQIHWGT